MNRGAPAWTGISGDVKIKGWNRSAPLELEHALGPEPGLAGAHLYLGEIYMEREARMQMTGRSATAEGWGSHSPSRPRASRSVSSSPKALPRGER